MSAASGDFRPGQRWFSTAEPELGLATVMRVEARSVQLVFTGSGEVRIYAVQSAPLVRAAFRVGDSIRIEGRERVVERVEVDAGLLRYHAGGEAFHEGELDAEQPVSRADSRLLSGRVDRGDQFALRLEVLQRRARARAHPGWGILGARIELIGHQLRVAEVAAARRPPRLLLADEVGLGKTIEACMVLAQQLAAGRVQRALVLVPDSLVNQWFVELLRRFNLRFSIFDAERVAAIGADANPFHADQLVLASVDWLAADPTAAEAVVDAGWDMLLVDEAHHLAWQPGSPSAGYRLVESLAASTPALLLLTATPEQLGLEGHFARLRLLDPARYHDLAAFREQLDGYRMLSEAVRMLEAGHRPDGDAGAAVAALLGPDGRQRLDALDASDPAAVAALLDELIDHHGTGRVMIRNRRAAIGGFPRRVGHLATLSPDGDADALHAALLAEFQWDAGRLEAEATPDYLRDPRLDWLLETVEAAAPGKLLVICHTRARVQAIEEALRQRSHLKVARFHEDMGLVQRDRNAAWFAEADGADVLVASEIGAEGRNFQFASHLLLWDLPLDPDLLEQRIGRLDRIGQRGDVHLHAAAVDGSPQQALLRWYHEGLGAFDAVVMDGPNIAAALGPELVAEALASDSGRPADGLDGLLGRTRALHAELAERINQGRDRLLEIASQRGSGGDRLLQALHRDDAEVAGDEFPLRLLEAFGIHHEDHGQGLWRLDPEYQAIEGFQELGGGPRMACFDRGLALSREDLLYLREDHPMLLSAQEMLLSGESGNAAFMIDELPPRTVLLEAVFVLECVAPARLDAGRFLPPTPVHVVSDTRLQPRPDYAPSERSLRRAGERSFDLEPQRKLLGALVPPMLEACRRQAEDTARTLSQQAGDAARAVMDHEIDRLHRLARLNPAITPAEIQALREERDALLDALPRSRLRLDALRLVAGPDFLALRGR